MAMAAMEKEVSTKTEEISGLKRALDKSDQYIEELETKVQQLQHSSHVREDSDSDDVTVTRAQLPAADSCGDDTFHLEAPSPLTPKIKAVALERRQARQQVAEQMPLQLSDEFQDGGRVAGAADTSHLSLPSPTNAQSAKKRLKFGDDSSTPDDDVMSLPVEFSSVLPRTQKAILELNTTSSTLQQNTPGESY